MARSMPLLLPLFLLVNLATTGFASRTVQWKSTTHSSGNPKDESTPTGKTANSDGSSHIYFHQTFSDVKSHAVDNEKPQVSASPPVRNKNLTSSELRDSSPDYQQQESAAENTESSDTPTSYSTSIDHGDFGGRIGEPPSSSGITKRNAHYPMIPSDVINDRDDDERPANDDDYGEDGEGSNDDGGEGGGDDYDDEPAESAPEGSQADQDDQGDGEVTEEYDDDRAQRITDDIDGDDNQDQEGDWLADDDRDDRDDFDHSASFRVPKIDGIDHKGCKTVYKEIKTSPTPGTSAVLRRKRSATSSYMIARECHFGNDNLDNLDKLNQERVGSRPSSTTSTTTTSAPLILSKMPGLFGNRLSAASSASQIPPPPVDPSTPGTVSSTTKASLPDGSTSVSSFYMSTSGNDMQSSDSMRGALPNSIGLAAPPMRHRHRRHEVIPASMPEGEHENMIPRPDKTRYHNYPYPHFHVYYDQPRLRDRIFARRWKKEYEKAVKSQEGDKGADKHQHKHQHPKHNEDDGHDHYDEDEDEKVDSDPLAAPAGLDAAPDTSVDFTSQETLVAGGLKSRQRRSRNGMYDNLGDNDIDQVRLPSSSDGQWTRYVTNSHSYSANPKARPKNIEYSYYREVNGPSTTATPTAAPVDDYRNRVPSAPVEQEQHEASSKEEPDYADETRSDQSSTPLNDDDYGENDEGDDSGEGGGQGEGASDDGNDDYGNDGGNQNGNYNDSYDSEAPGGGQNSDDGGGQQGDDNDDFFAKA